MLIALVTLWGQTSASLMLPVAFAIQQAFGQTWVSRINLAEVACRCSSLKLHGVRVNFIGAGTRSKVFEDVPHEQDLRTRCHRKGNSKAQTAHIRLVTGPLR